MKGRVKRVFSNLTEQVDAILLMNGEDPAVDVSFFYATGLESGLFEGCVAILRPDGETVVLSSALEETIARSGSSEVRIFRKNAERDEMMAQELKGISRIGINGDSLTVRNLDVIRKSVPNAEVVDVAKAIERTRLVKDDREVESIREACRIASEIADQIPSFLRVGMTEYEAAAEINYRMQKLGASSPSFETISSYGKNSAEPHHTPDGTVLRAGDFALFDFGAKLRRYCSDITRTFVAGRPTARQLEMYETVLEAQQVGLGSIRHGASGKEVDAAARAVISRSESKGTMPHSLGHGLGLSVHDGGRMAPEIDLTLEENMVLTVEPGMYVSGYGGVRIEDVVRVRRGGCELLTSAKKDLVVV